MTNYNLIENGVYGKHFFGNEISAYGQEHGFVDYRTLAEAFDAVLANNIMEETFSAGFDWEQESGFTDNEEEIEEAHERIEELETELEALEDDELTPGELAQAAGTIQNAIDELEAEIEELENEQDYPPDVFQWYIVSPAGAEILEDINEIVYYCGGLDLYLWGVTHYGTSWDYVLTDIPCNTGRL